MKIDFSIEKPIRISWDLGFLQKLQASGEYLAELKLDEDRGFIVWDENPRYHSYRGSYKPLTGALLEQVRSYNLPNNTVFDGGWYQSKAHGVEPTLWVFDLLVLDGERLYLPFSERKSKRDALIKNSPNVWLPISSSDFVTDFRDMLSGKSRIFDMAKRSYKLTDALIKKDVEGFVIKKLDAIPKFPKVKTETPASFKLRFVDVPKGK